MSAVIDRTGAHLWNDAPTTGQVAVIHDTESSSVMGSISWMESRREGSYHRIVAPNGTRYMMVPDNRQSWSAMSTGNRIGRHVCAVGYASYALRARQAVRRILNPATNPRDGICTDRVAGRRGVARWSAYPDMLESIAQQLADWHHLDGLPLVRVGPAQIRAGVRGVCGHADISAAFGESDHTDPGSRFPFDPVIARARVLAGIDVPDHRELASYFAQLGPT